MHAFPLRFQPLSENRFLFADDAGRAFFAAPSFADRFYADALTPKDRDFLLAHGFAYLDENDLSYLGYVRALAGRVVQKRQLNYLIAVPTLRCDLMCSYCQVSRVNADQHGFDWTIETEAHFLRFLDQLRSDTIQIEFQGGEPLLRIDVIERVIAFCEGRFKSSSFVICTNLSAVDDRILEVFARANVHVSTSLDGPVETHRANRTKSQPTTQAFLDNLANVIGRFGAGKVSALPTIDPANPPSVSGLLDVYESFGLHSIFLRPVSYHGFARKSFRSSRDETEVWNAYFDTFLEEILHRNNASERAFEEFYFTLILKRCLRGGENGHVDLRNPNPYGQDYLVIDHDGRLYPADEARMLTRSGIIDLSIGSIEHGLTEVDKLAALNSDAFNTFDPDCIHCAFQPACGADLIDDIARYGRRDLPRHTTFFCRRQTHLFKRAWELIGSDSPKVRKSLCAWLDVPYSEERWIPVHD